MGLGNRQLPKPFAQWLCLRLSPQHLSGTFWLQLGHGELWRASQGKWGLSLEAAQLAAPPPRPALQQCCLGRALRELHVAPHRD